MFNNTIFKFSFDNLNNELEKIDREYGLRHTISINKKREMIIAFANKCECGKQHYFKFYNSEFDELFCANKTLLIERMKCK